MGWGWGDCGDSPLAPPVQAGTSHSTATSGRKPRELRPNAVGRGPEFQRAKTFVVSLFVWFFPLMLSDRRLRRTRSGILPILVARRTP